MNRKLMAEAREQIELLEGETFVDVFEMNTMADPSDAKALYAVTRDDVSKCFYLKINDPYGGNTIYLDKVFDKLYERVCKAREKGRISSVAKRK